MSTKIIYDDVPFKERTSAKAPIVTELKDNILSVANPELAKEWHPTLNGDLTPDMVTKGSNKKVWWKCKQGHEWQAAISSRSNGVGCPYCSNKKVLKGYNDLETTNPELAKEWHPIKNGTLKPEMVTRGNNKKVWWLCRQGHEWQARINNRTSSNHTGCPYCAGQKVIEEFNDLVTTNPLLVLEWHPTLNGNLKPNQFTAGSNKKVWWMCKQGHEWLAAISKRSAGRGCPYCSNKKVLKGYNDLATVNPELASEWHPIKNEVLTPNDVICGSAKKVWWLGKCGHEWQARIVDRKKGESCPICLQESKTSFAEQAIYFYLSKIFPDAINRDVSLGKELDIYIPSIKTAVEYDGYFYHRNLKKDNSKNAWCKKHRIRLIRVREEGCPEFEDKDIIIRYGQTNESLCAVIIQIIQLLSISDCNINIDVDNDRIDIYNKYIESKKQNSFASACIEIVTEWHPAKNGSLTPEMVAKNSNKKVWWFGKCGHEWQAKISVRSRGHGCPFCSGYKVLKGFNDLATVNPILASEWHPTLNGNLTPDDVTCGSEKKVWWLGKCGHKWQANIGHRYKRNSGCPYCSNHKVLPGFNDIAIVNPKLALEWHPMKNNSLTPNMFTASSHEKVWWQCKQGHEWQATIGSRNKGLGCPYCSGQRAIVGINDLMTTNPVLALEWHPVKNGDLKPNMVMAGSDKKVWWQCKQGHEWQSAIYSRNKGSGCPYCSGRRLIIGINDLATTNPILANEWHPTLNGDLTPNMVTKNISKKVWWQCKQGHEWQAYINNRSRCGDGCPYCSGRKKIVPKSDTKEK